MSSFLKKTICLILFMILTVTMQTIVTSSLLTKEVTLESSGLISYSQLPSIARPLHVEGNKIKDDLGRTVYLRGFNVMGYFHSEPSGAWGAWNYYDTAVVDRVFDRLKSYGINFVREITNVQGWINNPTVNSNVPNLKWRDMMKDYISRAKARGIYVALSDYTLKPNPYADMDWCGYPPYATEDERDVLTTREAFIDYAVKRTLDFGQYENYIATFWFEPYWMDEVRVKEWQFVWQNIINGVRAEGYKGLILAQYSLGSGLWAKDYAWGNLNWYYNYPLNDPLNNMIISFHLYRSAGARIVDPALLGGAYTYDELKQILDVDFHVKDISSKVPVIAEEVGGDIYATNDDQFLANSLKIFNEWGISYGCWIYSDFVWSWQTLKEGTMWTTGGDLAKHGQIVVDAINS